MKTHQLRWALFCVAAGAGALSVSPSEASHKVTVGPGDSIDSFARRYHVSKADIAAANGISVNALLRDGRKLTIPDPPKSVHADLSMRRSAAIKGNRIGVRMGPDESYRRLTMLDHGSPVVVTHKRGDWFQVRLESGRSGWVRGDFLAMGHTLSGSAARKQVARATEKRHAKHIARRNDDDDRPTRRTRRQRIASASHDFRGHRARRSRPEASAPAASAEVVRTAYAYRGVPYRFGGSSRGGFDCSGFTSYVYRKKGVSLPHSAAEQFGQGHKVNKGQLKPGDLVFFHTTRGGISHVGIYAGKGKFVHASSGGGQVRVDSLTDGYYKERFRGARRVK